MSDEGDGDDPRRVWTFGPSIMCKRTQGWARRHGHHLAGTIYMNAALTVGGGT